MKCKIIRSVLDIPLKETNRMSGYNTVLMSLKSWEKYFGIGTECCFGQKIRFGNDIIIKQLFTVINKFKEEGYIEVNPDFEHIRQDFVKDEAEWQLIDTRVNRLVKQGKIRLVPYCGHPYRLYKEEK